MFYCRHKHVNCAPTIIIFNARRGPRPRPRHDTPRQLPRPRPRPRQIGAGSSSSSSSPPSPCPRTASPCSSSTCGSSTSLDDGSAPVLRAHSSATVPGVAAAAAAAAAPSPPTVDTATLRMALLPAPLPPRTFSWERRRHDIVIQGHGIEASVIPIILWALAIFPHRCCLFTKAMMY